MNKELCRLRLRLVEAGYGFLFNSHHDEIIDLFRDVDDELIQLYFSEWLQAIEKLSEELNRKL